MFSKAKDRIFAALLILCLIPIILVSLVNYHAAKKALFEQYSTNIREHMRRLDDQLALYTVLGQQELDKLEQKLSAPINSGKLIMPAGSGIPASNPNSEAAAVLAAFTEFHKKHASSRNICLIGKDGSILSLLPKKGGSKSDPRNWDVYHHTLMNGQEQFHIMKSEGREGESWWTSRLVKDEQGKLFGVLAIEWNAQTITKWLQRDIRPTNTTLLIFSKGNMLLYVDESGVDIDSWTEEEHATVLRAIHENAEEEGVPFISGKGNTHLFHYTSPVSGYTYAELLPSSTIDRQLDPLKEIFWVVTILVLLLVVIITRRVAKWIDRPIRSLVEATEALQKGDFSIRVKKHRLQEIAQLEDKFNQMASQLQTLIEREREYMQTGLDQIVRSFYLAVEMKDPYTAGHSERVTEYALIIYDHLDDHKKAEFSRDDLRFAGLMHDIGKVAIPDRVLLKDGKLTDEEYELIKLHASIGANIVNQIVSLAHVSPGVRHHHERWDGRGYPDRLAKENIPLMGRILAVADTFDAMTSTRSYRKALSMEEAHAEILRCSSTQFDPEIVHVFSEAYKAGCFHKNKLPASANQSELPAAAQA
ncbi:HD domain-containing phosphohydrolase [Brevibacillus borstelensis]|uniref:HD domain-containing phosphohydrolase n=1 Tax=Brevibacillus borstelensis TaxID=45462 RepID=UPI0030BCE071